MPRIPKNNQPQQAPVQSQQGGNVRAGTAQPTSAPAMEQQLASAVSQQAAPNATPQPTTNSGAPVQQSASGGNVRTAAEPTAVPSSADFPAPDGVSPAAQQAREDMAAWGQAHQQQQTLPPDAAFLAGGLGDAYTEARQEGRAHQQTPPANDRQEQSALEAERSHQELQQALQRAQQMGRAATQGIQSAAQQGAEAVGLGGYTQPGASHNPFSPLSQRSVEVPDSGTGGSALRTTTTTGATGTGGAGTGGTGTGGTGAGTAESPTVDTGATMTDPLAGVIGDYQGQAQQIIDTLAGLTQDQLAAYAESTGQTIEAARQQIDNILASLQAAMPEGQAGRVGRVDTAEQEDLLQRIVAAAQQQAEGRIDYGVQQAVDQLTRAQEDAQSQFQTMRDQVAADEAKALDNQALYAEARGDRGGIGQAQYGSIQNTAATNQLTVNREQTKLATDTARQIADLRAQGEFQKADQLLSLTQSYLSQLMELKQWADSTNVSIDEFNIGVEKWEQEFQQQVAQIMGGMQLDALQYTTGLDLGQQETLLQQQLAAAQQEAGMGMDVAGTVAGMQMTATQQMQQQAAQAAQQMISAGITPTDQQLGALGWTREQYDAYRAALQAAQSGGGGSSDDFPQLIRDLIETGGSVASIQDVISQAQASGNHDAAIIREAQQILGTAVGRYGYTGHVD